MSTDADDLDNDPDEPAFGEPPDAPDGPDLDDDLADPADRPVRRGRPISASTREAFKIAAAAVKSVRDAGELDDDLVPALDEPAPPPAKVPPAAAAVPDPAPAAPPAPPAPSLDPGVVAAHERLNLRMADLDRREQELEARAQAVRPADDYRERFNADMGGTIVELVREWAGFGKDAKESEVRDLFADLITDLGGRTMGLGVSPEVQARTEARSALRALKAHKTEALKAEERRTKEQEAQASKAERSRAVEVLGKELQAQASAYSHLAAEEDPGAIVMDVIEAQHRRDGTVMEWTAAAALADKYLKEKADRWYAKRRHLYATAPADKPVQPPAQESVSQGDRSDHRRSQTLTNDQAAARPTPPADPVDEDFSPEAHRQQSLRKLRKAIAAKQQQP